MNNELKNLYESLKEYDKGNLHYLSSRAYRRLKKHEFERARQLFNKVLEEVNPKEISFENSFSDIEWLRWDTATYMFVARLRI